MNFKNLKISIITVSFNSRQTIEDTIESVFEQDYENLEHIIIDGGSNDGTLEVLKKHSNKIHLWVSEKDDGIYDAMNKGILMCNGDVVGILNSDDVYSSNKTISTIMHYFNTKPSTEIVFGNINYVSRTLSKVIRRWRTKPYKKNSFVNGWHPPHPAFFVKKKTYQNHGLFNLDFKIASDFELMLRLIEIKKCNYIQTQSVVTHMRVGGKSNNSFNNILLGNREVLKAFKTHNIPITSLYFIKRIIPKIREVFKCNIR